MNQEQVINKVKHLFHTLKEKIHHEHKAEFESDLNEYDKMKLESLMKKELQNKIKGQNVIKPTGNNRDISAI